MDITNKRALLAKTILTFGSDKNAFLIHSSIQEAFRVLPEKSKKDVVQMKATKIFKSLISSFSTKYLKNKYNKLFTYSYFEIRNMERKELIKEISNHMSVKISNQLFTDVRTKENSERPSWMRFK